MPSVGIRSLLKQGVVKTGESPALGVFSEVAKASSAKANSLSAAGLSAVKNHQKAGFGYSETMTLNSILSTPTSSIGPGSELIRQARINMNVSKAAKRMSPETMMPLQQNLGNPTAPNILRQRRVMLTGAGPSEQITVRARANSIINTSSVSEKLNEIAGGRRSVNVNLKDSRSTINPYAFANGLL